MPGPSTRFTLSDTALERIREQEDMIVTGLINDLQSTDEKVVQLARKQLIELGFTSKEDSAKGVVAFLLEKARAGEFGKHAAAFSRSTSNERESFDKKLLDESPPVETIKFIPGAITDDDTPPPENKQKRSIYSGLPIAALDLVPKGGK